MARAYLNLPLAEIGKLAVAKYMGDRRLGAAVGGGGVIHRLLDLRPCWPAVRDVFFAAEVEMYSTGGASGDPEDAGIPWAPNGGDYGAWKIINFGNPPGVLTGTLMSQLIGASGDHYEDMGLTYIELGSNAPVGNWSGNSPWTIENRSHVWSTDSDGEDVGGLMAQGGSRYRKLDGTLSESVDPRPPISITEQNVDEFIEVIMDYVTQAPLTKGWFNPRTGSFSGRFSRVKAGVATRDGQPFRPIRGAGSVRGRSATGKTSSRQKAPTTFHNINPNA